MSDNQKKVRALGLCSGGLDSMLAGVILRNQNIDVQWITFETPFFSAGKARKASTITGIPLRIEDITDEYLPMLKNPPVGYGKWMNPCMDCHSLMFKVAGRYMKEKGYDFLFSGEVLGQRPMSQTKPSLRYVEKHSGFDGYILRPLSAKRLPETVPEQNGWVNRELLYDFSGRSRKPQIELAKTFGIDSYPAPAGGCLLTDKGYSNRLKDLFKHKGNFTASELHLLKYGRHFRLKKKLKLIIGRTKFDNQQLIKYHNPKTDTLVKAIRTPSPFILIDAETDRDTLSLAAAICIGYSKVPNGVTVDVLVKSPQGRETIQSQGISPDEIRKFII